MRHADPSSSSRRRLILSIVGAVVAVVAIGAGVLVLTGAFDGSERAEPIAETTPTTVAGDPFNVYRTPGWIKEENAKPGTTEWHIPDDQEAWRRIEGFSSSPSIDVGGSFDLSVSTRSYGWIVSAYRIGYYGGTGGRLIWRSEPQKGVDQGGPVLVDAATETWVAPWKPSISITTDATWPPGQYLLRLASADGGLSFVPLVIRDDKSRSDLLVQSAVTTWQAYNGWGGASVYTGKRKRADVVSFDRPYTGNGSGEFLGREFEFDYFVERLGLDVSYWTGLDLHARGELAKNHRGIVIPGHDEYYTVQMRENLEAARDAGVNIGFFGANNVYRRIRLSDAASGPMRLLTNYRSTSDPYYGKNDKEVTTSFREPPAANPESTLTGSYYECNPVDADWVVGDASLWMFEGSGFKNGDRVPHMVGNEYDRVTPGAPTPANISILAHSPVTCRGQASHADTTWYTTDSGAGVFTAATFQWSPLLITDCPNGVETSPQCRILKVTENILRAFAAGPAGRAHPSVSNTAKFNLSSARISDTAPTSTTRPNQTTTTGSGSTSTTAPPSTTSTTRAPTTTTTTTR